MPGIIPCRVHAPDVEHGIGRVHVQDCVPFRRPKKIRQAAETSPPWQEVLVGGVPRVPKILFVSAFAVWDHENWGLGFTS